MSEYQYYEFVAVDRPLTKAEMAKLRGYSTRARITPTRFVNEYHWGNFKGHPEKWMEAWFDAHLYVANWGTRNLYLRLPGALLDFDMVRAYLVDEYFDAWEDHGNLILSFALESEDGGYEDDCDYGGGDGDVGEDEDDYGDEDGASAGALGALLPLRAELAQGDLRALYLGWLLGVTQGQVNEDEREPPVPPGLGTLTGSQAELVRFLKIDSDLMEAAAEKSATERKDKDQAARETAALRVWLAGLPGDQKDAWLARAAGGEEGAVGVELRIGWLKVLKAQRTTARVDAAVSGLRTAGELLRRAEEIADARRVRAAEKAAREKAVREREAEVARERHLDRLAASESELWPEIQRHAASKLPKRYDEAIRLLLDLRDLAARRNDSATFAALLAEFRASQARKPSLLARIDQAFPEKA